VSGVILTGAWRKAFIAGADISQLAQAPALEAEQSSPFGQEVSISSKISQESDRQANQRFCARRGGEKEIGLQHLRSPPGEREVLQPEVSTWDCSGGWRNQRLPRLVGKGVSMAHHSFRRDDSAQEAYRVGSSNDKSFRPRTLSRAPKQSETKSSNAPDCRQVCARSGKQGLETSQSAGMLPEASYFGSLSTQTKQK